MSEIQSKEKATDLQVQENSENEDTELKDKEVKQVVRQVIQEIQFSGPIPPPNIINGYEQILPGAADRILAMAEKQSEHRQQMEKKMIESESRDGLLGVLFGFCLGLGCIIAAIVMACVYPQSAGVISGAILGTSGVVSIAITVIKSTRGIEKSTKEHNGANSKTDDLKDDE